MAQQIKCECQLCPARLLSVFHTLPNVQLDVFNRSKVTRKYKKGEVLFSEGDTPAGVFCIFEGQVKVFRTAGDGREKIVKITGRGDVLGFSSLFAEESYSNSAQALEDSTICFVDRNAFFPLLSRSPDLAMEVIKKLSRDILVIQTHAADLGMKAADQRLAGLLLMLKETFGVQRRDGIVLSLPLSRKELAEMIGTTTETLIRLLSRFQDEGLVAIENKEIVIKDMKGLGAVSVAEA